MKKVIALLLATNWLFCGCVGMIALESADSKQTPRRTYKTQQAYISADETPAAAQTVSDISDKLLKKYDSLFQKQLARHFKKHGTEPELTSQMFQHTLSDKPLIVERPGEDWLLVWGNDTRVAVRAFDNDGTLFGWGEGEVSKKTKDELLLAVYDYRLTASQAQDVWQQKGFPQAPIPMQLKYVWFLKINKKTRETVQFLYGADRTLKNAQVNDAVYVAPGAENLLVATENMQHLDTLKYNHIKTETTPEFIQQLAQGVDNVLVTGAGAIVAVAALPILIPMVIPVVMCSGCKLNWK